MYISNFLLIKCYYSFGQAFEILTEIKFKKLFLDLHDKNCLNMCFISVILLVFIVDLC